MQMPARCVFVISAVLLLVGFPGMYSGDASEIAKGKGPKPKVVALDLSGEEYVRVLGGPPETVTMRAGFVVLSPKESVGTHNTKNYEEALVVLGGVGEMVTATGDTLRLKSGAVAYCPPRTEHNVFNTGSSHLRYVYIVANAE